MISSFRAETALLLSAGAPRAAACCALARHGLAFLLLLLVATVPGGCAPDRQNATSSRAATAPPRTHEALDAYVEQAMRDWSVPGLAIAIVARDSIVLARGYGVRRAGEAEPVNAQTLFGLLSPTKAFTTTALAMLVEEGRISWDDPVVQHLPDFRLSDTTTTRELRVRDLVSHRSGYPDAPRLWYGTGHGGDELVRRLADVEPLAPPGAEFHYNNLLYVVAGEMIETVAGMSWHDFVRERIFLPLGMERSATSVAGLAGRDNVASPHARRVFNRVGAPRPIAYFDADNIAPAGMIHTNALEMTAWLRLHLNEGEYRGRRLLEPASLHHLWQPQIHIPDPAAPRLGGDRAFAPLRGFVDSMSYGLGWFLLDYRGQRALIPGGGLNGQRSAVGLLPDVGAGVVILSNMQDTEIALALLYQVFDLFLDVEPRDWSRAFLDARRK
jgi:CubicO group peptidase (beta-lactamase class C family)